MRRRFSKLRYQVFRSQARALTHELLCRQPDLLSADVEASQVRIEPITREAVAACLEWPDIGYLFPWEEIVDWKDSDPKGFDLAIWFANDLCGLCYASPRKSSLCIKVILLQGNPSRTHPLRGEIAGLALTSIDFYARMLGCQEIEVQDPLEGARSVYEALGFTWTAEGRLVIQIDS
ncbi:hypothetical protein TZ03_03815 [Pseudomonas sp. 10-1B]|uniref:hypothetical protein n=1 Tax=Pseudomonas sp. 10-1B TaxID=1546029 RepID=UPI00061FA01B|nr:hypothetical protein [Pseudomonas sp. 10-1B]KIY41847.1 hypothetical protein TZ03_03815 [Pseudomonas sp. 10-1B]